MIIGFENLQKLGQSNLDSAMRMFGKWNNNWQAIAAAMGNYANRSFEEGSATLEKLMGSKSVEQVVEIQTSYAKRAYDDYMQQVTKIGGMYANMAQKAYRPIERSSYSVSTINISSEAIGARSRSEAGSQQSADVQP